MRSELPKHVGFNSTVLPRAPAVVDAFVWPTLGGIPSAVVFDSSCQLMWLVFPAKLAASRWKTSFKQSQATTVDAPCPRHVFEQLSNPPKPALRLAGCCHLKLIHKIGKPFPNFKPSLRLPKMHAKNTNFLATMPHLFVEWKTKPKRKSWQNKSQNIEAKENLETEFCKQTPTNHALLSPCRQHCSGSRSFLPWRTLPSTEPAQRCNTPWANVHVWCSHVSENLNVNCQPNSWS